MRDNPIQFAVVREDPLVEAALVRRAGARRILLIASGGCTALTLQVMFPALQMTLVDANPAQLELVRRKMDARRAERPLSDFNVDTDDPAGLSACGNFESLFRGLRDFLFDLVQPYAATRAMFERGASPEPLIGHRYWPVAFELFFHDALLNTMFGPDATQHAAPGSYPRYFQGVFERGLRAPGAARNHFLHHVLLGHYLPGCLPRFLTEPAPPAYRFSWAQATVDQVESFAGFDLVSLSNVMDWMAPDAVAGLLDRMGELDAGATVVWRQLNNDRDLAAALRPRFDFDGALEAGLHAADRSLFYSSLHVGVRR